MSLPPKWICCQIGAREHYSVPRALHRRGVLERVVTDTWVKPHHPLGLFHPRLAQRFNPDLADIKVDHWNTASVIFEAINRKRKKDDWWLFMQRNKWFQLRALRKLKLLADRYPGRHRIVFSYSYASGLIFEFARTQGWTTILGQIDPGPPEEEIVKRVQEKLASGKTRWIPAPQPYWKGWFEEVEVADAIVVNSNWSKDAMLRENLPENKICTIPLAYEGRASSGNLKRTFPARFTMQRPLRVLFLGQVTLRKGMGELLTAINALSGQPVEFDIVGPIHMEIPDQMLHHPQLHWRGAVPRGEASHYYEQADLFILPTLSDGFGLTQLEAQAWKLPVIASPFCGKVVTNGFNGMILPSVSGEAIENAIRYCIDHPDKLADWSDNSEVGDQYSLDAIGTQLCALADRLCSGLAASS